MKSVEGLDVFKLAHQLALKIYSTTKLSWPTAISSSEQKDYALSVIRLFTVLPKRTETQILGSQLLRAGTSVGAQYREAHEPNPTPISSSILLCTLFSSRSCQSDSTVRLG
jgi:hypothetical protein